MKIYYLIISIVVFYIACKNTNKDEEFVFEKSNLSAKINDDFMKFWTYYKKNIDYVLVYKFFDDNNNEITNLKFLDKILNENFMPVKFYQKNKIIYRLEDIKKWKNIDTKNTLKNESLIQLNFFKKEGVNLNLSKKNNIAIHKDYAVLY